MENKKTFVPISYLLIAINLLVFLYEYYLFGNNIITGHVDGMSLEKIGAQFGPDLMKGEYWRIFSAMFLHASLMHIGSNMLVLLFFGGQAERAFGSFKFLFIYFISGLAGGLLTQFSNPIAVSVGASGAIFGLLGALLSYSIVNYINHSYYSLNIKTYLLMILLNLYAGFTDKTINMNDHVGGLIAGGIIGLLFAIYINYNSEERRKKRLFN